MKAVRIVIVAFVLPLRLLAAQTPGSAHDRLQDTTSRGFNRAEEPARISGQFEGAEGRAASGSYEIVTRRGVRQLVLSDDFAVQDEPEMWVVLSPAPYIPRVGGAIYLGKLTHLRGAQRFTIPAAADLRNFGYLLLWCRRFGMPVGQANLVVGLEELRKVE